MVGIQIIDDGISVSNNIPPNIINSFEDGLFDEKSSLMMLIDIKINKL